MEDTNVPAQAGVARRHVLLGGAALATAGVAGPAFAQGSTGNPDFLFVQTATGMQFEPGTDTLTLSGIAPQTLFFSDRPERIAGNMKTSAFVPFWSEGTDSFLSDPPNADLSIETGDGLAEVVVVLRDPVLDGDSLRYTVTVTDGELPTSGGETSLFIDIIGMPLTPVSFAGVRRRAWRRGYIR